VSIAKTAFKGVTFCDSTQIDEGYTLFSTYNRDVWLIDMEGYIVHRWKMPYTPGAHQWLLPSGNLLFAGMLQNHEELGLPIEMAAIGGVLLEVDWDSNLVWKAYAPYQNHDIHPLENGNVLYHSYNPKGILPKETASRMRGGMPGTEFEGNVWGDMVHEINRNGEILWEWKACDHLDPELDASCMLESRTLWPYINSLWMCRNGSLLIGLRAPNEIIRIDYATGEIIDRYGRDMITHQHDARELENGNILIFDNGCHRREYRPNYSRVIEIDPGTGSVVWEYRADPPWDFFSPVCGGSERLKNGNTVICDSWSGRIFEVNREGELVWEYISPFRGSIVGMDTTMMWRAHRYPADYPGLKGRDFDPKNFPLENRLFGPESFRTDFTPSAV